LWEVGRSSSLPTSTNGAWSTTRPFALPRGSHRAVGTRWVHTSLRVQPVQAVGQVVQLLREQVAVAVQGDHADLWPRWCCTALMLVPSLISRLRRCAGDHALARPPAGQQPGAAGSRPALRAVTMAGCKPRPHLLDELMPAPAAEAAAERPHPLPPDPSRRVVVKIQAGVADQGPGGRAAPAGPGQPTATLAGYVEDALRERLERGRAELNQGEDFPPVTDHLRPGRRIGG
jgi:hypothetical protein